MKNDARFGVLFAGLSCALILILTGPASGASPADLNERARQQVAAGKLDEANKTCTELMTDAPNVPEYMLTAAMVYDLNGDYDKAVGLYRTLAYERKTVDTAAPLLLALELLHKDYDAVIKDAEKINKVNPGCIEGWIAHYTALACKNDLKAAHVVIAKAVFYKGDHQPYRKLRFDLAQMPGAYDAIREECLKQIMVEAHWWDPYAADLARAAIAGNQLEKLKADIATLRASKEGISRADAVEGISLVLTGHTGPEVRAQLKRAIDGSTRYTYSCFYASAMVNVLSGDPENAFYALISASSGADPTWADTIAEAMNKNPDKLGDNFVQLEAFCKKLVEYHPTSTLAAERLVTTQKAHKEHLERQAEIADAKEVQGILDRELPDPKLAPQVLEIMKQADAAEARGDRQAAIECYTKVRQIAPGYKLARLRRAVAYILDGQIEAAEKDAGIKLKDAESARKGYAVRLVVESLKKDESMTARRLVTDYLTLTPDDPALLAIRVEIDRADKNLKRTLPDLKRLVVLCPDVFDFNVQLSEALMVADELYAAEQALVTGIQRQPKDAKRYLALAQHLLDYARKYKYEYAATRAFDGAVMAVELGEVIKGWRLKAEIYEFLDQYVMAQYCVDELAKVDPTGPVPDLPKTYAARSRMQADELAKARARAEAAAAWDGIPLVEKWRMEREKEAAEKKAKAEAAARSRPKDFFEQLSDAFRAMPSGSGGSSDGSAEANSRAGDALQRKINERSQHDAHVREVERRFGSDSAARERELRPK